MSPKNSIKKYYNELAADYDENRFENSYGQYLHLQERQILVQRLGQLDKNLILDLGCGTGRFLEFANNGADFSEKMLEQAQSKFPNHDLRVSDISKLPFPVNSFKALYSLHVFMHLEVETIRKTIHEAHRVLQSDGIFIFDIPSQARRQMINYQEEGWHGNTALDIDSIRKMTDGLFEITGYEGVLFFPIHRIPKKWRPWFRTLDSWLGKSFLKKWASYHFVFLQKK